MSEEPESDDSPFRLAACAPTVVARRLARLSGQKPVPPREDLAHVANYLYMLRGACPNPAHVAALEAYFVMTAEHGLNASTFAARVAASTGADIATALCAALSAMKGPLHGGAPAGVLAMLEQIGTPDRAEVWVRGALARGERIMGFGHRVYRTRDPRARVLEQVVVRHAGEEPRFLLARELEKTVVDILREQKPNRALYANVDPRTEGMRTIGPAAVGLHRPLAGGRVVRIGRVFRRFQPAFQGSHVVRKRGLHRHVFSCQRMRKRQAKGVQRLTCHRLG
jgi:citrate synthase